MKGNIYDRVTGFSFGGLSKVGYVVMAAGLFVMISPLFIEDDNSVTKSVLVGAVALLAGAVMSFTYKGIEFDFAEKRLKEYTAVLGVKMGQWEIMPPFHHLTIHQGTYSYQTMPNGVNPSFRGTATVYRVSLHSDNSDSDLVLLSESRQRALKDLKILGEHLNLTPESHLVS